MFITEFAFHIFPTAAKFNQDSPNKISCHKILDEKLEV